MFSGLVNYAQSLLASKLITVCLDGIQFGPQPIQTPKGEEVDITEMLLYPNVCGCLTTELLISISWISRLPHLVRQGKPDENPLSCTCGPILDVNRDANIEAAVYPLPHFSQATLIGSA
ncbi:hypothetical protein N7468_002868 [Penicillium chermesinum]|uniref:Uncharacterized protein n=1 Tax=Penicillium chermesinum TaxID=63820 RepID=A0A9W9TY12_9EURO|nr:uncharacterized protein N7468_002868 [Penicillium chermesinum]KAJ5247885.1 hypothetical protein N7468_002868 [Penicillium chermesinum]